MIREIEIDGFDLLTKADPDEALLWQQLLGELKFRLDPKLYDRTQLLPGVQKLIWNSKLRSLPTRDGKSIDLRVSELMRRILYALASEVYGEGVMAEAICSAFELYFTLNLVTKIGIEDAYQITALGKYEQSAAMLNRAWVKNFNKHCESPFGTFREFTKYLKSYLEISCKLGKTKDPSNHPKEMLKKLHSFTESPFHVYVHSLNIGAKVLYLNFHSKRKTIKNELSLLNNAKSMMDLLNKLKVKARV